MAYLYLVASLPLLALDGELPWSPEEFYHYCENLLSPSDLRDLRRIVDGELEAAGRSCGVSVGRRTKPSCATRLCARAPRARAGASRHPQRPFTGFDVRTERVAAEAMGAADPLERERTDP